MQRSRRAADVPKNIEIHLSKPMTFAAMIARSGMPIKTAAESLLKLACAGLLKLTDKDRGLYRVSYLTTEKTHGQAP